MATDNDNDFVMIPVDCLMPTSYNPNFLSPTQFAQLVAEVSRTGRCQKPIVAKSNGDGTYNVVDGEHNLRAAIEVGLMEVPVELVEVDDYEARRQTFVRNLHGTFDNVRLGRMLRDMMPEGSGRTNCKLAADLGVTEGTVRNKVLYARASDLRAAHDSALTDDDIANMKARKLREYVERLEAVATNITAANDGSDGSGSKEPADLRALKRAWDKASDVSRATFLDSKGLRVLENGLANMDAGPTRNSYESSPAPGSALDPKSPPLASPRAPHPRLPKPARPRLRYGISGEELLRLCKAAGTTISAVAEPLGYTGRSLSLHVNCKSAKAGSEPIRLAIVALRKQAKQTRARSTKQTSRRAGALNPKKATSSD